jgi:hypothetical protein
MDMVAVMAGLVPAIHVFDRVPNKTWMPGTRPGMTTWCEPNVLYTGKLSCFRPGISTVLPRSIASARAIRGRVACGMITSSI